MASESLNNLREDCLA